MKRYAKKIKQVNLSYLLSEKKKRLKRLVIAGIVLFIAYLFGLGDYGIYQYYQLRNEKTKIQAGYNSLLSQKILLEEEEKLVEKKDPEYFQRIAREKYGLVKPGEKIYKLVPKSNNR